MSTERGPRLKSKADLVRKRKSLTSSAKVEKVRRKALGAEKKSHQLFAWKSKATGSGYSLKSTRPRRKINIPLSDQGLEVQVPMIHLPNPGWRILSIVLLAISVSLITIAAASPVFKVNQLEINGLTRLQPAEIESTLRINGENIFLVEPSQLQNRLLNAYPEIKNVTAEVTLPDKVSVIIEERIPVMLWTYDQISFVTDQYGKMFTARSTDDVVISIQAEDPPPLVPEEFFMGIEQVVEFNPDMITLIEENEDDQIKYHMILDPTINQAITKLSSMLPAGITLVYNQKGGLGWNDPNGWKVYVGTDLSNLDQKLIVYQNIVEHLQQSHMKASVINVEYVHTPYYRLER